MVLPAVVALLGVLLACATAGVVQLQLEKAAQAAVRQLGRGESESQAMATVSRIAGQAARLSTSASGGWVSAKVTAQLPGPWGLAGGWTLEAEAAVPAEPAGYDAGTPGSNSAG
jgi:predicted outer membrane lipoprotein